MLPNINNSERLKFDVITIANKQKKPVRIKFRKNANYAVDVMSLINFMIDEANDSYSVYEKECLNIFEQVYKRPEKRIKPTLGKK